MTVKEIRALIDDIESLKYDLKFSLQEDIVTALEELETLKIAGLKDILAEIWK